MIRFLQNKDSRIIKAVFVVIIAALSVGMVVYLIPGLTGLGAPAADAYATIYPHWYSRIFSAGATVTQQHVTDMARQQLMRRNPQYAENPMIVHIFEQQVGQQLVQQQVLLAEAQKLGIRASDDDVIHFLHQGQFGEYLFPNGQYIGSDRYAAFVASQFNLSVAQFEKEVKQDIIIRRLESLITSGVSVGAQEVRNAYRKANLKIKFDYAVISSDDLRKTINPSDGELESFFKKNNARYATAVPEQRKITYFSFTPNELPGGSPQPSQQEIQQYFTAHKADYALPEQARSRHILIKVAAGADPKADAAARAKAEGLLKQIKGGANFADLARKNSDDPGSKAAGGELGFAKRKSMVPEFDNALFTQKIGDTKIIKTQFGYHIIQVEERQAAHTASLNEVLPTIQATLVRQKASVAEEKFARDLTSEAIKNGLAKTAAAHHLPLATTSLLGARDMIAALPDSSQIMEKAFQSKQSDPAQAASTGEGFAIFQVTGIAPAHAPNFAEYKSRIADDYRSEQLPGLLAQKTKDLAAKAKASGNLAAAAKAVGATVKSSDLISPAGQVPDFGEVGQVAPQLFDMKPGDISGAINAQRTGVVAKIVDKQEPSAAEIAGNFDQTREQLLEQRRSEVFNVFLSGVMNDYKKHRRIQMGSKGKNTDVPVS
jgi:peptidyl-prolyl cis-trans isomerase D